MRKIIVVLLFFALSINNSIVFANNNSKVNGKYVIINNQSTNPYDFQSSGTIKNNSTYNKKSKTIEKYGMDKVIELKEDNENLYNSKEKNIIPKSNTRDFTTLNFQNDKYETITAKLKYSGKKADIWVHEDKISDAQAILLGQEFDNKIYSLINENFGEESDVDRNSKINILIYDIKDNYGYSNAFIEGYFNPNDLYNNKNSNNGEILYIDTYPTMEVTDCDGNQGIENLYTIIVHEFQHMVSFNENKLKENKEQLDTWIDEGLSMAAERMYTKTPRMDRIEYYNRSNGIVNGHSLLYWDYNYDTLANYSLSYLFMEYLNLQLDKGDSIYKEIIKSKNNNYLAVEEVIKKYLGENTTFGEFTTDFRLALALNQSSGKYGFKGEDAFDKLEKRIYRGSNIDLRGGGAVVVEANGSLNIPSDKGEDIIYVGSEDVAKIEKTHIQIIGENRYDTAAKISKEAFKGESDAVILINGKNSSDGLSAGPFAALIDAPMLLVEKDYIPEETISEIKRLKPKSVYLIGGKEIISEDIKDDIKNIIDIDSNEIKRIGGANREETSLLIFDEILKISKDIKNIYVVNGYKGEADAMSILSKACNEKSPILITNGNNLSEEQRKFITSIEYPNLYFIGGHSVIKDNLIREVRSLFDVEVSSIRLYGDNREDTNAEVLDYFYKDNIKSLIVAKGYDLIDALCVGTFAGKNDIPIVIASNELSEMQSRVIRNKNYDTLIEVGGGISHKVINSLK